MPAAYSSELDRTLEQEVFQLIEQLNTTTFEDSSPYFDKFAMNNSATLLLRLPDGTVVVPPSNLTADSNSDPNIAIAKENEETIYIGDGETILGVSYDLSKAKEYTFSYMKSEQQCTLIVIGEIETVNQVIVVLLKILPWLICAIIGISALAAFLYSRYITKPIVAISTLSKKMANMELEHRCDDSRNDEIGILANSFNEMAKKLSRTLEELQSANKSLKKDIDKERELDQQRMVFFSAVSHELKTPVTALQGQLEGMLQNYGSYKNRDKYLARSLAITQSMEHTIQKIVTISHLDASDFSLHAEVFDFSEVVREIAAEYIDLIEQKGLNLEMNVADKVITNADKKLIEKVISNLFSNALRYSPNGERIVVNLALKNQRIEFSLYNTGVHIQEDALSHLFEAFYRADGSRSRQTGGTGLGLYLVGRILEQHHAIFQIRNIDLGVEFCFSM